METGALLGSRRYRQGMNELLRDMEADYFVTANFNRDTSYEAARKALKGWHARVDKVLLGGSWSRKARAERTQFVAFVEHLESNLHWHLLLRLGEGADEQRFEQVAEGCWLRLVKSGSLDVEKIDTSADRARVANYVTKDLWRREARDGFVLSGEFRN